MNYHFVWCPKYRRKLLVGKVETRLRALLQQKVEALGCKVLALEIMPDHVHLFLQATPIIAPNRILAALKGYSSHELRKEFPELATRLPTLWSRSYFVSTHGHVSSDTIKHYSAEQKGI
jgi:putative transposase